MSQPNSFIPFLPDNAPFSNEQRSWLNGYLAGLYSNANGAHSGSAMPEGETTESLPLTILYGSETGNTEVLARKTAKSATGKGFSVKLTCMSDYDMSSLTQEENLLLLTSTYGEGEPPDNALEFYNFLHSDEAPKLEKTRFSVLALGDSSYPDFCKCGIDFDNRLAALGAERLVSRVDCDVDFDEAYDSWFNGVIAGLSDDAGTSTGVNGNASKVETEESVASGYDKKNPFPATVLSNFNLNGESSAKETRHVEICLKGSGLTYEAGDALGVYPRNCPELVAEFIERINFDGSAPVNGKPLAQVLEEDYDITKLTAGHIKDHATRSDDAKLKALANAERAEQNDYCWGRELIDLYTDFPVSFEKPESFLATLKKLSPRLYSISSSPNAHPEEVHVTVGAVRYESHGRARKGVCSTYLADRCGDNPLPVFFHHNKNFRLPEDKSLPIIMVGPGTGIAPFRAFLEERKASGAPGKNWLFFGDQHEASDFLYCDQLEGMLAEGSLGRLDAAFSRDQSEKVYVQDRMRENAEELYRWLEAGACFYVCGDASRMAKDVDAALHDVIVTAGGKSPDEAVAYVKHLKSEKRYCRDVY